MKVNSLFKRHCAFMCLNLLPHSVYVSLLILFASSLDPDKAQHDVEPDLNLNCLTLALKIFFRKNIF